MAETLLSDRRSSGGHDDREHRDRERGDRDRDRDRLRDRERDRERDRDRDRSDRDRSDRDRSDRERDRVRERDYDRPPRSRRDEPPPHYERERRDREEERERSYRRRVVERDVEGLNYGDEKPSVPRRRRAEDDEDARPDSRDSKRLKIETPPRERTPRRDGRLRTRSPQPPPKGKEEPAGVHSGSEEGEIEED